MSLRTILDTLREELVLGEPGETECSMEQCSAIRDEAIEAAENDLLKLWIRSMGPEKVLAWAAARESSIRWEGRCVHPCQARRMLHRDARVAHVIREYYKEIVVEVVHDAWRAARYVPSRPRRRVCPTQIDMPR
ncbi:hypothetical protein [Cystobacter ferrugineus]|uniref:Uncharacterized protein n=1 Tax=Cystobacter ferrugineus TaxID=83449 RepID=A0A1L9BK49_9BACT|nr:hypothetical protein [Cystobacter ferrugineus]OJH42694.1 hypothetical protein BON30_05810 [Cystobacter ferrugineus]